MPYLIGVFCNYLFVFSFSTSSLGVVCKTGANFPIVALLFSLLEALQDNFCRWTDNSLLLAVSDSLRRL